MHLGLQGGTKKIKIGQRIEMDQRDCLKHSSAYVRMGGAAGGDGQNAKPDLYKLPLTISVKFEGTFSIWSQSNINISK